MQKADDEYGLAEYRKQFEQSYDERWKKYEEAKDSVLAKPDKYRDIVLEPPMKLSFMQAYPADLYGLDHAKRDCRFEMIKIVREVGAPELDVCLEFS